MGRKSWVLGWIGSTRRNVRWGHIRRPCRTKSISSESNFADLQPPRISPQRPCAFRRAAQNRSPPPLMIFISLGTRRAKFKKNWRVDIDANLHRRCKLRNAFCMHLCITPFFFALFYKNVVPALGGKHISEKRLRISPIKNLTFLTPKRLLWEPFV